MWSLLSSLVDWKNIFFFIRWLVLDVEFIHRIFVVPTVFGFTTKLNDSFTMILQEFCDNTKFFKRNFLEQVPYTGWPYTTRSSSMCRFPWCCTRRSSASRWCWTTCSTCSPPWPAACDTCWTTRMKTWRRSVQLPTATTYQCFYTTSVSTSVRPPNGKPLP